MLATFFLSSKLSKLPQWETTDPEIQILLLLQNKVFLFWHNVAEAAVSILIDQMISISFLKT